MLLPTIGTCGDNAHSIGFGLGPIYNGLGLNYEIPMSTSSNYFSLGCPGIGYGDSAGLILDCGLGYSFVSTILSKSNKHGIGGNIGLGYSGSNVNSGLTYHAGVHYSYFYDGIHNKGWNFHIGPAVRHFNNRYSPTAFFGFGYQF